MNIKKLTEGILIILSNYQKVIKNLLYFLIYIIFIIGSSTVITLPLWYAATKHSKGYTIIVILVIVILTGLSIIRQLRQCAITKQKLGMGLSEIILIPFKKIAVFIFFTIWLYGIIFIYSRGLLLIAVPLTVIYIFTLGYFIFIYRKMNAKNYT